jgi:hypothetical protein
MKRKILVLLFSIFFELFPFSQSYRLDDNAHIFSYNDLKMIFEMKRQGKVTKLSANEFYHYCARNMNEYSDNSLMQEKIAEKISNTVILIYGYVSQVRRSFLDEYIVELEAEDSLFNVSVVYPKKISQAMIDELTHLRRGNYFESLVITRKGSAYVDVPVWSQNNVYLTEP